MEKKVIYLGSDFTSDLDFDTKEQRDELAKSHPEREIYSLGGFQEAFNDEMISDLGLIYIVDEDKVPKMRTE